MLERDSTARKEDKILAVPKLVAQVGREVMAGVERSERSGEDVGTAGREARGRGAGGLSDGVPREGLPTEGPVCWQSEGRGGLGRGDGGTASGWGGRSLGRPRAAA